MDENTEKPDLTKKVGLEESNIPESDMDEEHDDLASEETELEDEESEEGDSSEESREIFSVKKILTVLVIILIVLGVGWYFKSNYTDSKQRTQIANQILTQVASTQDVKKYLGNQVVLGKSVTGTVDSLGQNAQLVFAVQGEKGQGTLVATLTQGQLTELSLGTVNGQQYNVLKDEAAYTAAQAAKAAIASKQQAVEKTFNDAVNALKTKDYQAAITGFTQSLQNTYQVAQSYQYLGFSYSQTNQYTLCVSSYEQYLKLKPTDSEAHYQLAYCYLQMYQTNEALAELDKSCQLAYQAACDAATQIKGQLHQKAPENGYSTLSPQQTINQQKELQNQLQSNGQVQDILNSTNSEGSVPPNATGQPTVQPAPTQGVPQPAVTAQPQVDQSAASLPTLGSDPASVPSVTNAEPATTQSTAGSYPATSLPTMGSEAASMPSSTNLAPAATTPPTTGASATSLPAMGSEPASIPPTTYPAPATTPPVTSAPASPSPAMGNEPSSLPTQPIVGSTPVGEPQSTMGSGYAPTPQ